MAVERVAVRVSQGGHNIPEPDIRRRYGRGLLNLAEIYLPLVDRVLVIDARYPLSALQGEDISVIKVLARKDENGLYFDMGEWPVVLDFIRKRKETENAGTV